MTFRAKPAVKRTHRPAYQADHRRTLLLNIGFGLVVLVSLLILGGAAAASWYGDHLAALATVNGQSISKDDYRDRARVDNFRLDYEETQLRQRVIDGKLDQATADSAISTINNQRTSLSTDVMDHLIDATLESQLAGQQGVAITDQQVDAQLAKDASSPESRHVWVIGTRPVVSANATAPTDQQKADARAKAQQALADIKAGKPWAEVAKGMTDDPYSSKDGEVGWITKGSSVLDAAVESAMFSLPVNGVSDVIEGSDGIFHIARVTEIQAPSVDQAFQQKIKDANISLDSYRRVARADALQQALNDKIVNDVVTNASAQRHVAVMFLKTDPNGAAGTGDEVQVRHILYAPNHDPQAAQALAATDPAWKAAEDLANAAYAQLQKDPTQFADLAKNNSDDAGTKAGGGLLPYYTKTSLDKAFADAVFADGLKKDQILPPVKSAFGWHVIQFLDRRKQPSDRIADIRTQLEAPGADFAAIVKANSEDTATKDQGGDAGWVAKYQLDSVREIAIFKAPVGGLTETVTTADGIYIYKILAEENRQADAKQAETIRAHGFSNWYTAEKLFAKIERLYQSPGAQVPTVQ